MNTLTNVILQIIFMNIGMSSGFIMTGRPVHGDFVFCIGEDFQVVISGGLCNTKKNDYGKRAWGNVNNDVVLEVYEKINNLKFNSEVNDNARCSEYNDKYYVIAMSGGCMISVNDITKNDIIMTMLSDKWNTIDLNTGMIISNASIITICYSTFMLCSLFLLFWSIV